MIRKALVLSVLLAAGPMAAHAQGVDVRVSIGPDLMEKADELGRRDLERLARELEVDVERAEIGRAHV